MCFSEKCDPHFGAYTVDPCRFCFVYNYATNADTKTYVLTHNFININYYLCNLLTSF